MKSATPSDVSLCMENNWKEVRVPWGAGCAARYRIRWSAGRVEVCHAFYRTPSDPPDTPAWQDPQRLSAAEFAQKFGAHVLSVGRAIGAPSPYLTDALGAHLARVLGARGTFEITCGAVPGAPEASFYEAMATEQGCAPDATPCVATARHATELQALERLARFLGAL